MSTLAGTSDPVLHPPSRFVGAVSRVLGGRSRRARAATLAGFAAGFVLLVVGVPIAFALSDGRTGLLLGLTVAAVTAVVVAGAGAITAVLLDERSLQLEALRALLTEQEQVLGVLQDSELVTHKQLERSLRNLDAQVQANFNLRELVPVRAALPTFGLWTASADFLVVALQELVSERPRTVVEAGSGVSTVLLALAARHHGVETRIVALEHDPTYAESTRRLLARHGVADGAEVRLAPLVPTGLPDHPTPWYDAAALADLTDVGMLVVDGPPSATGQAARFPMLPLLLDRLAPRCSIVVDDTVRPGDRAVIERWQALAPEFSYERLPLEKGGAVLRRG